MTKKPTTLEKIAGNPLTEIGATLIATVGASHALLLAPLLPILQTTLANQRQQKRIESALEEVSLFLAQHETTLQKITDDQYHLLTESISATFQTINPKKLIYLQSAIKNCLVIENMVAQQSAVLARIIRDISAEEADFVVNHFRYKYIHVTDNTSNESPDVLRVPRASNDSLIVAGLESLGVLVIGLATYGDGNKLCFSNITAKLLFLLNSPNPSE
jgi:hypothetical protein